MMFTDEILSLNQSPFYEKWKKGRPTKEQLEKRRLHNEWLIESLKKHPHKMPMLSFLLFSNTTKT